MYKRLFFFYFIQRKGSSSLNFAEETFMWWHRISKAHILWIVSFELMCSYDGALNCSFLIVCVMIVLVCWFTCVCVHRATCVHTPANSQTHTVPHTPSNQSHHTRDATSASISHVSVCPPKQAVVLKLLIIYARAEIASPRFTTSNVNVFIGKLWFFFL